MNAYLILKRLLKARTSDLENVSRTCHTVCFSFCINISYHGDCFISITGSAVIVYVRVILTDAVKASKDGVIRFNSLLTG